jgi:hypothetical protein
MPSMLELYNQDKLINTHRDVEKPEYQTNLRILIVDDELFNLQSLVIILKLSFKGLNLDEEVIE